jgi:hypothetical protein
MYNLCAVREALVQHGNSCLLQLHHMFALLVVVNCAMQAAFVQLVAQLPQFETSSIAKQQQQQQQPHGKHSEGFCHTFLSAFQQQQLSQQPHQLLTQLLSASVQWFQTALASSSIKPVPTAEPLDDVSCHEGSSQECQSPAAAWDVGHQLLMLAAAVAEHAPLQELHLKQQSVSQVQVELLMGAVLQRLQAATATHLTSSPEQQVCAAAVWSHSVATMWQLLERLQHLHLLSNSQLLLLQQQLVAVCLGGSAAVDAIAAATMVGGSNTSSASINSNRCATCSTGLTGAGAALDAAAATALAQHLGCAGWGIERLQLLVKMLRRYPADPETGISAVTIGAAAELQQRQQQQQQQWDRLVHLLPSPGAAVTMLLLAVDQMQQLSKSSSTGNNSTSSSTATVKADESVATSTLMEDPSEEPDYFHIIFEDATGASVRASALEATTATADNACSADKLADSWVQLAVLLCQGIAGCLNACLATSDSPISSSGGGGGSNSTSSSVLEAAVGAAVYLLGLYSNTEQQQQQHHHRHPCLGRQIPEQLQEAQLLLEQTLQSLADRDVTAAGWLFHLLLLTPPASAHVRITRLVARAVLQHAGNLVAGSGSSISSDQQPAVAALLHEPWRHLAASLSSAAAAATAASHDVGGRHAILQDLVGLLTPHRLALLLAVALAASPADQALLAAVMIQSLSNCMAALKSAPATAPATVGGAHQGGSADSSSCGLDDDGGSGHAADASDASRDVLAGPALALCALHSCLSLLLWLLQSATGAAPVVWLQLQLQGLLNDESDMGLGGTATTAAATVATPGRNSANSSTNSLQQLLMQPLSLYWVSELLHCTHETDELSLLLRSFGLKAPDHKTGECQWGPEQQLKALRLLLPGVVPDCFKLGVPSGVAATATGMHLQQFLQLVEQQMDTAVAMLGAQNPQEHQQQEKVHPAAAMQSAGVGAWGAAAGTSYITHGTLNVSWLVMQVLDGVLPQYASWCCHSSSRSSSSIHSLDWPAAVALTCCQQRGLQLLLLLQQLGALDGCSVTDAAATFNSFGTVQHLIALQQQLQLVHQDSAASPPTAADPTAAADAAPAGDSHCMEDAHVPVQMLLHNTCPADFDGDGDGASAVDGPTAGLLSEVTDAAQLFQMLLKGLEDATQKLQLSGAAVPDAISDQQQQQQMWCAPGLSNLIHQQLPGSCAAIELLGLMLQVSL